MVTVFNTFLYGSSIVPVLPERGAFGDNVLLIRCVTCTTPCRNAELAETPQKATRSSELVHHVCFVYLFVGDDSRSHVVCKG